MPSSGALNMAGTSSPVSVAYELGLGLTTTISMNDTAVRTLAGAGGSGTSWSMSSLYGKSNITINNSLLADAESTQVFPTTSSITFNTNGTMFYEDTFQSTGSANWATPTTAGIGSSYWVKITRTSGSYPSGMTSGTIYSISTAPTAYLYSAYSGANYSAGNVDIYSDSGGATRVGGGTYYILAFNEG